MSSAAEEPSRFSSREQEIEHELALAYRDCNTGVPGAAATHAALLEELSDLTRQPARIPAPESRKQPKAAVAPEPAPVEVEEAPEPEPEKSSVEVPADPVSVDDEPEPPAPKTRPKR